MFSLVAGVRYLKNNFGSPGWMGNETSSVKIHKALDAKDIKGLRSTFPGGGNGPAPCELDFGLWSSAWHPNERSRMEQILRKESQNGEITFHDYQDLAGNCVRGTTEARVKLIFRILHCPVDKTIKSSEFESFVLKMIETAGKIIVNKPEAVSAAVKGAQQLTLGLIHELVMSGEMNKNSLHKSLESDMYLDFDMIERWLVMKCPLFETIYSFVLATSFGIDVNGSIGPQVPPIVPKVGVTWPSSTQLSVSDVIFLNHHLPTVEMRSEWRPLFNARVNGESFAKMSAIIMNKGPTLVIVWEENGYCFGGFASDSWKLGPKFYGNNTCFLFSLSPKMYVYESTTFNNNFMYFNMKQKTMPNGIGMGGQLEYMGLWLDSEYGKGKCAPSCSSFQSPQLSKEQEFKFSHVEVWGLGPEPVSSDDEGEGRSALDLDPEAQAVMEMMGKTFVSKVVKAQDEQDQKEKEDQKRNEEET